MSIIWGKTLVNNLYHVIPLTLFFVIYLYPTVPLKRLESKSVSILEPTGPMILNNC